MNLNKYILLYSFLIIITICIICGISIVAAKYIGHQVTNSPVEEMYHKQLVVTLDSILDARFGPGCCEEDIDTVSANTFHTRFGGSFSPMN